jgi:hypothetical protein
MEARKRHRCVVLMLAMAAGFAGSAQAVEFEQRVSAPMVRSAGELRSGVTSFAARARTMRSTSPVEAVTDATLAKERFDLRWKIDRLADSRTPLAELAEFGIEDLANGSFRIDLVAHPEWNQLDRSMTSHLRGVDWDQFGSMLVERGFRPSDVDVLRAYVSGNDSQKLMKERLAPITLSFRKLVKAYDKIKRPVTEPMVLAYIYQRAAAAAEVRRAWASGALSVVDEQRKRILLSIYEEMGRTIVYAPENLQLGVADILATMRDPNFDALVKAELEGNAP